MKGISISRYKHNNKYNQIIKKVHVCNQNLIELFLKLGISRINFTSVGNSIAAGYSTIDEIIPLLLRNEQFLKDLKVNHINFDIYNFTKTQDNCDSHIFKWLTNNTKQSDINKQNQVDLCSGPKCLTRNPITYEKADEFYPLLPDKNIGLRDILLETGKDLSNIMIYNGCTGSFLDNIFRGGSGFWWLDKFKMDLTSLECFLKTSYHYNPNTQIYVCGIPQILTINIAFAVNKCIKRICSRYLNATYVEPVSMHFIYRKGQKFSFSLHPNQWEYLNLICNIFTSIKNNYIKNKFFVELDNTLSNLNYVARYENDLNINKGYTINEILEPSINKYKLFFSQKDLSQNIKDFIKYYNYIYPHNYFNTKKEEIISILRLGDN